MSPTTEVLIVGASTVAFVHTLLGPDHYLPFVALARARRWTMARALGVTLLCGAGHVAGSVLLGMIGLVLGLAVGRLELIEGVRGDLASWALIVFGLLYLVWGLRRATRHQRHSHLHAHADGTVHAHEHDHHGEHLHPHDSDVMEHGSRRWSVWALFIVFALGPCEPLIPLFMVPASEGSIAGLLAVTAAFALSTLATMALAVLVGVRSLALLPTRGRLERYSHALAGGALLISGLAVRYLGL